MIRTLRKPKWLALLAGVLLAVAIFGWLGKWQLDSAIASAKPNVDPELAASPVPLTTLIEPQEKLAAEVVSRTVTVTGWLTPGDLDVLSDRSQHGELGWWVVGRLAVTDDGQMRCAGDACADASALPGLAVALMWLPTEADALTARDAFATTLDQTPRTLTGTLEVGQDPVAPRTGDVGALKAMAPGQLLNRWDPAPASSYSTYVVVRDGLEPLPAGAEIIERADPNVGAELNWLNIFYAIEWAIFIVMAFYLWWRLVRDDARATAALEANANERLATEVRREKLLALAAARASTSATANPVSTDPDRANPNSIQPESPEERS